MSSSSSSRDGGQDGAAAAAVTAVDEVEAMTTEVDDDEVQIQGKRKRSTDIVLPNFTRYILSITILSSNHPRLYHYIIVSSSTAWYLV
jgi:hypothetical protein